MILHVVDSSCPHYEVQMQVVDEVLNSLGAGSTPRIDVYNKVDKEGALPAHRGTFVHICALTGQGLDDLLAKAEETLNRGQRLMELFIPYEKYDAMQALRAAGSILEESYEDTGTRVKVMIGEDKLWKVKRCLE